jgi:hypothetical protein
MKPSSPEVHQMQPPLGEGGLTEPGVQCVLRAYHPGGPPVIATFPFELDSPPRPPTEEPAGDRTLLVPGGGVGRAGAGFSSTSRAPGLRR